MVGAVAVARRTAALCERRATIALHRHRALQNGGDLRVAAMARQDRPARWPAQRPLLVAVLFRLRGRRNGRQRQRRPEQQLQRKSLIISVSLVLALRGSLSSQQPNLTHPERRRVRFFPVTEVERLADWSAAGAGPFMAASADCDTGRIQSDGDGRRLEQLDHCEFLAFSSQKGRADDITPPPITRPGMPASVT